MTVHRLALYRSDDPYTRVPNSTVRDPRLDLKARGLLLIMLSKPDGWNFTERNLAADAGVSRQQVRTAIETLAEAGYLVRERITHEGRPVLQTRVYDVSSEGPTSVPSEGPTSVPTLVRFHDRREPGPVSKTDSSKNEVTPTADAGDERRTVKRQPDLLFEAVVDVCGHDPSRLTKAERGRINAALKDLRTVDATPEQVRGAARAWQRTYPNARLTATALSANWSTIVPKQTPTEARTNNCEHCGVRLDAHDDEWCAVAYRRVV